ncbi:MAG TPA: phosphoglycolate phosphatase [Usitatibacter sp.]|jgi:phosphoglycolate phosphatase|nr:phosphoglycolate phosphatase [Usitatibacter sp.]
MIAAVIFDLDGTLVESAGEIHAALALAFGERGIVPLPMAEVERLIGRGVHSLVERALAMRAADASSIDKMVESFETHYARTVATQATLFRGTIEGLRMLRAAGLKLAVVTNKPRVFTETLLAKLAILEFFAAIVAGDDGVERKPAGDMLAAACTRMGTRPSETLMLGDSQTDVRAARAAGCPVWCVPYGYNEGRDPATLACDRIVATVEVAARLLVNGS